MCELVSVRVYMTFVHSAQKSLRPSQSWRIAVCMLIFMCAFTYAWMKNGISCVLLCLSIFEKSTKGRAHTRIHTHVHTCATHGIIVMAEILIVPHRINMADFIFVCVLCEFYAIFFISFAFFYPCDSHKFYLLKFSLLLVLSLYTI